MLWFLNRVGAGAVAAALTGLVAGFVFITWSFSSLTGTPKGLGGAIIALAAAYAYGEIWYVACAVVLGGLQAVAILCLTKAKHRPWRSLPILVAGALIGFLVVAFLLPGTSDDRGGTTYIATVLAPLVLAPTLGALLASFFLKRQSTKST